MFPQRIPRGLEATNDRVCALASRWGITEDLARRLVWMASRLPFEVWIFSGARTRDAQSELHSVDFSRSTHADHDERGCPRRATGADVQPVSPGVRIDRASVAQMGAQGVMAGLRWGGGAPFDEVGIPVGNERWHFDTGPR